MTPLDPRDQILQAHVPAVMVPRYGELPPIEVNGHRFLVANDGVYIEVRRPWLHVVWPLDPALDTPLPYGTVSNMGITLGFDAEHLRQLTAEFIAGQARENLPNECGAWILWSPQQNRGTPWLMPLEPIKAGPGSLTYTRPKLPEDVHVVCDIHSHARGSAFFSPTDDRDDAGDVRYAAVAGNVHTDTPDTVMRLCLPGGVIVDSSEWAEAE